MNTPTRGESVLLSLGIERPEQIDLEAVAWSLGAIVKYRPMDKAEATIVGNGRNAVIAVNSDSRPVRQRFSIAHEVGHWQLHRRRLLYCAAGDIGNPSGDPLNPERQADDFASDLLLPDYLFRPRLAKLGRVRLKEIDEIAEEFQASRTATLIKAVDASRFPVILACYGKQGLRWWKAARIVPGWWKLQRRLDEETFAGRMLFAGASEELWPRRMPAEAWFDFRGADRYEVQEQSFSLPGEEVLAVITIPEAGLG